MSHGLHRSGLSIDVGTSGVRAALFDERGSAIESTQVSRPRGGGDFVELDPDVLVEEVVKTVEGLSGSGVGASELIAISTFWHSLMGVDASGAPTTPLLTWADTRATQQAKELRAEFDEREIHARTGCRLHPSYWPAKLRWLKAEHPRKFDATSKWLGFGEYLCLRLFGESAASVSMASATGLMNQSTCDWDAELIRGIRVPLETLPRIFTDETRIVVGDGAANNVGGNCTTKATIALMIGTSGAMRVVYTGEPPAKLSPSLWSYRVSRERVVVGGALSDGGGLLEWLVQSLNTGDNTAALQQQLAAFEPDSHGLTILPFWSGERSTGWHAEARGGIFGLRQQTTTPEILRAALEAIAYRFALIAEALDEIAPGATVIVTGNALRSSPVWLQIIADVLGRPVMLGSASEASMRGAALLALEAVGKIGNLEAVPVSVDEVFEPDMQRHARYRDGLARQQDLYERLFGETS
ncbi:MAG: gluconokinase [Acidobacteria bacterium]|nr:gluconokinase [Acidobacteriota bacterium]MCA1627631.1 gluconokinase [Acidobacteriota bacterium]